MAQIDFRTFKEWGNPFCIEDYKGWLEDKGKGDRFSEDKMMLAGIVLFDNDNILTLKSFLEMADRAGADIIMIEYCNITDEKLSNDFFGIAHRFLNLRGHYYDLESYENRDAFGKWIWD